MKATCAAYLSGSNTDLEEVANLLNKNDDFLSPRLKSKHSLQLENTGIQTILFVLAF